MMKKIESSPTICTINRALVLEVKKKDKSENVFVNGQMDFSLIRSLDLHLREDDGREERKIRVIENLFELVPNLEHLSLSYNVITKIQGLHGLKNLVSLNLAENAIEVFDVNALSSLSSLEKLNLSGNYIKRIPADIYRLSLLTDLRLARNRLEELKDLTHLVNLPYLTNLTADENQYHDADGYVVPADLYRLYCIFHLTVLKTLDVKDVTAKARRDANRMFGSVEAHADPAPSSPPPRNAAVVAPAPTAFTPVRPHSPSHLLPVSANKLVTDLQQRNENLAGQLLKLNQEKQSVQSKLDQLIIMNKHSDDRDALVSELRTQLEEAQSQRDQALQREEQTRLTLTSELTQTKEEVEKQRLIIQQLESEWAELQALHSLTQEEISTLRSNILNSNVAITKDAVKKLSAIEDWKVHETRLDLAAVRVENDEIKAANARFSQENEQLIRQLSETNTIISECRAEIQELKSKNATLHETSLKCKQDVADAKDSERRLTVQLNKLKESRNALENERVHYKILSEQLEADLTSYLNAASQKKVQHSTPHKLAPPTLLEQRIFPHHQQQAAASVRPPKPPVQQQLFKNHQTTPANASYFEGTSSTDSEEKDFPHGGAAVAPSGVGTSSSRLHGSRSHAAGAGSVSGATPVKLSMTKLQQAASESMAHMLLEEIYNAHHGKPSNGSATTPGMTGEYIHDSGLREACARAALRLVHASATMAKTKEDGIAASNGAGLTTPASAKSRRGSKRSSRKSTAAPMEEGVDFAIPSSPFEVLGSREYLSQLVTETQAGIAVLEDSASLKAEIRQLEKIVREKEIRLESVHQETQGKEELLVTLKRHCEEAKSKANETLDELAELAKRLQAGRDDIVRTESEHSLAKRELELCNNNLKEARSMGKIESKNLTHIQSKILELKDQQKAMEEQLLLNRELLMKDEDKLRHAKGLSNEQLRQLQADFHRIQCDYKAKQRSIEDLDKQRRFMEEEQELRRRDAESLLSTLTRQYEDECRKLNAVKEEIAIANIERDQMHSKRRQLDSELSNTKEALAGVSARYDAEDSEAKRKLEHYDRKLQEYEKKARLMKGGIVALEGEQTVLRNAVEELRRQQTDLDRNIDARRRTAEEELSQMQSQLQITLREVNQKKADLDHGRAEVESLASELHILERRFESTKRNVHEQELLLDQRKEAVKSLELERDRIRHDTASLKKNEDNLHHKLQLLKSECDNERRALEEGKRKLSLLMEEEASLKDSHTKLRNGVSLARKDLEESQAKLDHLNSLCEREKRELMDIRTKKSITESDVHRLDEELKCSQLRNNDENIRKVELEAALMKANHEINRTTREIVLLDKQLADAKRNEEEMKRREQELRISQEKIRAETETQKADLQHERATLEKLRDEHRTLIVEIRRAAEENRRVQQELDRHQLGLEQSKSDQMNLDKQKEDLMSEIHDLREKCRLEMLRTERLEKNYSNIENRLQSLREEMQKMELGTEKVRTMSVEEEHRLMEQKRLLKHTMEELARIEQSIADANRQLNEERHRAVNEISYLNQAKQSANAHVLQLKETQKRQERSGSVLMGPTAGASASSASAVPAYFNFPEPTLHMTSSGVSSSGGGAEKIRISAVGLSDVFPTVEATNTLIGLNHKLLSEGPAAATVSGARRSSVATSNASEYQQSGKSVSPFAGTSTSSSSAAAVGVANPLPTVINSVSAKSENAFSTLQQELEALNRLSTNAAKGLAAYT